MSHSCVDCMAPLEVEDGHDLCPSCLGISHLQEGLSEDPCMNCKCMPWSVRAARLREVELQASSESFPTSLDPLPAGQLVGAKRPAGDTVGAPVHKRARSSELSMKVQQMSAELDQMKELLRTLQPGTCRQGALAEQVPPEDDAISIAASATLFGASDAPSQVSASLSRASTRSSSQGSEEASMGAVIRGALARLQLDAPQEGPAPVSAFFRKQQVPTTFAVPPSEDYIKELHACWTIERWQLCARQPNMGLGACQRWSLQLPR